jgi:hypothetical protein
MPDVIQRKSRIESRKYYKITKNLYQCCSSTTNRLGECTINFGSRHVSIYIEAIWIWTP